MAALMVIYRTAPGFGLLLLPAWVIILLALAMGLGLWTSAFLRQLPRCAIYPAGGAATAAVRQPNRVRRLGRTASVSCRICPKPAGRPPRRDALVAAKHRRPRLACGGVQRRGGIAPGD